VASTLAHKRTRGPNRQTPWARRPEDGLSVLRLPLDTTDPVQRRRVEGVFGAAFSLRRALQSDARKRARAYWAAVHERERGAAAVRARLGLTRKALEDASRGHINGAPHLRRFVTKALAMHLADSVWAGTERHLFADARGRRHGRPRIGKWYDFRRLPGRAQSHTEKHKWETFRLHGSLAGHRAAYTRGDGRFYQPALLRPVVEPAGSWWRHDGPLVVVVSGLPGGELALPVRLPTAPCNQPILDHHLGDPSRWHKIDLVRTRDPNAPGGWRYEAHLMVLTEPYVSPSTRARRELAAGETAGRNAGIDVNVANVTVASHQGGRDLQITRVARDGRARAASARRARRERRRQRDLERSRRAANRAQYELSKRQAKRAARLAARGLTPPHVIPSGPRKARADGKPLQAYGKDILSNAYRRDRAAQTAEAASTAQTQRDRARRIAGQLVREHGFALTVEDCDVAVWARQWGRSLAAFSPGTLLAAITHEAAAVARLAGLPGGVVRAATHTTALSQHCLCGERVAKSLRDRVHRCPACDLCGDRDAVAATLAAHVVFGDRDKPASAVVDYAASRACLENRDTRDTLARTLPYLINGRQDARSESTAHSARDGWSVAEPGRTPDDVVVARRIVGTAPRSIPNELGRFDLTTSERARMRTNTFCRDGGRAPPLRDKP